MTLKLPITQVDAFADRPFAGNPAAVMPLDAWLDDATLQNIALENNLSETAFTVPLAKGQDADFELRWFTPVKEVALCGHATLASGHVLIGDREVIRFRTRQAGILEVRREGEGYAMRLPNWKPTPQPLPEVAAAIGGPVIETFLHERGYAVLVYPDAESVIKLTPDLAALKRTGNLLGIATAPGIETDIVSRAFAPVGGIDEDPVTGSAHSVIAPWWAERLGRSRFTAYQASARGGYLTCEVTDTHVILGGQCRTVMEGMFFL